MKIVFNKTEINSIKALNESILLAMRSLPELVDTTTLSMFQKSIEGADFNEGKDLGFTKIIVTDDEIIFDIDGEIYSLIMRVYIEMISTSVTVYKKHNEDIKGLFGSISDFYINSVVKILFPSISSKLNAIKESVMELIYPIPEKYRDEFNTVLKKYEK